MEDCLKRKTARGKKMLCEYDHSVGHLSQPARKTLGVVAHRSPPHVPRQRSKDMTAACCLGNSFQHGTYLCCPGPGKNSSYEYNFAKAILTIIFQIMQETSHVYSEPQLYRSSLLTNSHILWIFKPQFCFCFFYGFLQHTGDFRIVQLQCNTTLNHNVPGGYWKICSIQ